MKSMLLVILVSLILFFLLFVLIAVLFRKVTDDAIKPKTGIFLGFMGALVFFALFYLCASFLRSLWRDVVISDTHYSHLNKDMQILECFNAKGKLVLYEVIIKRTIENGGYEETPCKDGRAEGVSRGYYEGGRLFWETLYKDGRAETSRWYYEDGKLMWENPR